METIFSTNGTCARSIAIKVEDGLIQDVNFDGGCNGNLQGISRLVAGMDVETAINKLSGIRCGSKATSCPDQLARALRELKAR